MKIRHITHFMKIEIRPEIDIPMCNFASGKIWKRSVAWFPSYGVKCVADAERNCAIICLASHSAVICLPISSISLLYCSFLSELCHIRFCVTLRGRIKEAARTLRKQDPALPENHALNRCEVCFKQV